ncbi:MAG: hypothetical protein ACLQVL_13915 [Terriglobia bacterium]
MAGLTQIDWQSVANEANVRALLEDFISQYSASPVNQLALAVWFDRDPQGSEHKLLMLFTGLEMNKIEAVHHSLLWKAGVEGPPFITVHWTSVAFFTQQLRANSNFVHHSFPDPKVIYFQRHLLSRDIVDALGIAPQAPSRLIKVWGVSQGEYKGQTIQSLLTSHGHRPDAGIVKTLESPDFETCKAIVHVEVGQQWLPSSPQGVTVNAFYSDWKGGQPGYFLAEGGALYQINKFEVIYAPDYASRVLERRPDDRYVEVYLRAVHPPEQPAA